MYGLAEQMAKARKKNDTGANLGFEAKLWLAADKMRRLTATLSEQFAEAGRLEKVIRKNLEGLGYGG